MQEKKTRGRGRPKKINNKNKSKKLFDINMLIDENKNEYKNLLVHLPIDINSICLDNTSYEQEYLNYDNILNNIKYVPEPFEQNNEIIEERIEYNEDIKALKENIIVKNNILTKNIYKIENFNQEKILCWWCCHEYNDQNYGIPIKKKDDIYLTKGFFCSLNCAKSYNNNENIDLKEKQYRNSLINMLNSELTDKYSDVKEAPPRETLKLFGGILDINDFRIKKKNIKLIYPPIISLIPEFEDIMMEEEEKIQINKNIIENNLFKIFK